MYVALLELITCREWHCRMKSERMFKKHVNSITWAATRVKDKLSPCLWAFTGHS